MNIAILTNTFTPHVGGVARSVQLFSRAYRERGHRVLVVAPVFDGAPSQELDVVRVPAIQHFNGSDWSVPMPVPGYLTSTLSDFQPEIVHSQHPFLLGDAALRIAATWNIPCVFTHHTQYDRYTHYVPGDSLALKRFVTHLVTGYCNLCNLVVAPSNATSEHLRASGVTVPVEVIPTGIDLQRFTRGDPVAFRARWGIPADARVVGHVGRLAPEKNLGFLGEAVAAYLQRTLSARFLVVGSGPSERTLEEMFAARGLSGRLHCTSTLRGDDVVSAYRAMDVFAFASTSETQGLVLAEAAAAGVPLVALEGPGVSDVVRDRQNGRLLSAAASNPETFAAALDWMAALPAAARQEQAAVLQETAREFSIDRSADRMLALYARICADGARPGPDSAHSFAGMVRLVGEELKILAAHFESLLAATIPGDDD